MKNLKNFKFAGLLLVVVLLIVIAGVGGRFYLGRTIDVENFMKDLRNKMVKEDWLKIEDYSKVALGQHEGEYEGFDWLNEENEIELIKGFWLSYDPQDFSIGDTPPDEDIMAGVKEINSYLLEKDFVLNERNKWFQQESWEEEFWETGVRGHIAYEKGNIKCYLGTEETNFTEGGFSVGCGDISKSETPPEYRAIYYEANPGRDLVCSVGIDNIVDNFAVGGSGCPFGAGKIWKEENGEWKELFATQMGWSCKILLENKVPPSLFEKPETEPVECIFYTYNGVNECKSSMFEKECQKKQEESINPQFIDFIYQELYEKQFGKEK